MIEISTSEVLSPNTKWDLSNTYMTYMTYIPCNRDDFLHCVEISMYIIYISLKTYPIHQVVFTVAARSNLVSMFMSFKSYCV